MRKFLPLVFVVGALSGCATDSDSDSSVRLPDAPIRPETTLALPVPSDPSAPPPSRYYLDDGPPENHGVDIAAIPDAVPKAETILPIRNQPYRAFGKLYEPFTKPRPHRETGAASWYGRRYHGRPTASGEIYDMFKMTAAHPILPIPSYARVTRADNGRSVVVRVNDRGPFLRERVIDLSYAAAVKLGMIRDGSAAVVVESVLPEGADADESIPEAPESPRKFFIQVGAFSHHAGAGRMLAEIQEKIPESVRARAMIAHDSLSNLHRVGVGEFPSPDAARAQMRTLCRIGICGFVAPLP